jgi:hypothetical protein
LVLGLSAVTAIAGEETILEVSYDLQLVADTQYDLHIYGEAKNTEDGGLNADYGGIFFTIVSVLTPESVGVLVPIKKPGPVEQVSNTFGPRVIGGEFRLLAPLKEDIDGDGDDDSLAGGFVETANWYDTTIGVGGPDLLMTQKYDWDGVTPFGRIVIEVDLLSRYYDINEPQFPPAASTEFDKVVQLGGGPEPTPPVADAGPDPSERYTKGMWGGPGGWNGAGRSIILDGSGTTEADGDTVNYEWTIVNPLSGEVTTIDGGTDPLYELHIGEILGDLPTSDQADTPYPLSLTATDRNGSTSDDAVLFVPEPGTMLLLSVGCVGALLRRRRR